MRIEDGEKQWECNGEREMKVNENENDVGERTKERKGEIGKLQNQIDSS